MCGLVGIYLNNNSNLEEERYEKVINDMATVQKHRGPDDKGVFVNKQEKLAFGFQRLSIIDLNKNAGQPMISKNKDWLIVYNGEIYNYRNLRKELNFKNSYWQTNSDTEVLLECIAKFGFLKTIKKLNGMFAIAAFSFSNKTLWLARDKFGEKPLYYNYNPNEGFCFSSDIKSFKFFPGFKKNISMEGFAQYIRYGYVPDPLCILKNTYKLEAGGIIKFDKKNLIKKKKYWDSFKEYAKGTNAKYKGKFDDAKEELKEKIDISTKARLISDVPLGIFLSGGIDSSNIALSLKRQGIQSKTFSIGFYDKNKNELDYANQVAKILKTNHSFRYIDETDCIKNIYSIADAYDEPFSDPSQIPTYILSKYARKKITVALSGDGADELFCGYPRYKSINNFWENIKRHPKKLKEIFNIMSISLSASKYKKIRSIGKKFRKLSHLSLDSIYRDEMSRWRPDENIYKNSFLKNSFFDYEFNNKELNFSNIRYLMLKDLITYLPSNLLVKTDRASMANSLEIRSPFLDSDLVSFAWKLPDNYISKGGEKSILKSILLEKIPSQIVYRKKQGFEPPLEKWLPGELKSWAYDLIEKEDDLLDKKKCIQLMQRLEKGEKKLTYKLWTIIMFKSWKNLFFS